MLGFAGDAGEIADVLPKLARGDPGRAEHVAGELGDVLFYWVRLCAAVGVVPADLLSLHPR